MTEEILEVPEYAKRYVELVDTSKDILYILAQQSQIAYQFYAQISEEKSLFRYAENKWTIKELVQHIIDSERVMAYRALRFARIDNTELAGFDQDKYVMHARANHRNWLDLQKEFILVRESNIFLYQSFDKAMLLESGLANGYRFSVTALGFMIVGHEFHHRKIIQDRYL
jgi:hypothetical protein